MGKYEVEWRRIWDFLECVEAESEDEARMIIHEERATKGSTIEIGNVVPIPVMGRYKEEEEKEKEDKEFLDNEVKVTNKIIAKERRKQIAANKVEKG